jgi:hypothetical protein
MLWYLKIMFAFASLLCNTSYLLGGEVLFEVEKTVGQQGPRQMRW